MMKVLGLAGTGGINKALVTYACSLFKQVSTEVIDLQFDQELNVIHMNDVNQNKNRELSVSISTSSLLVVSISLENISSKIILEKIHLLQTNLVKNKPLLLLITTATEHDHKSTINQIQKSKLQNVETFILPDYQNNFEGLEISNIRLRLELIRTINRMMYEQLKIRNNSYFTCGIDIDRDYCGDAIEY